MNRSGEKTAIIKSANTKLSSSTFRNKVNNISVLQRMVLLQDLPRATQGNRFCCPGESKTECDLWISLDSSQGRPNPAVLSL